jgi:hypothetical protein
MDNTYDTFLRRKDAEEWALEVERRIDRGEPPLAANSREQRKFGDLVRIPPRQSRKNRAIKTGCRRRL